MPRWLDRLLRFALALLALPVVWFTAVEPFLTMQRLVPVQATLVKVYTRKLGRTGASNIYVSWIEPYVHVAYEYEGVPLQRFAELQVDDRGLRDHEVEAEVEALRPRVGGKIDLWVDPRHPKDAYVHRRMRAARAWGWIAASLAFWAAVLFFRPLFIADPPEEGTGDIIR